jgi:hypothetical protein
MNKIDLTKGKWCDSYWDPSKGLAGRSAIWLAARTNVDVDINNRLIWLVSDGDVIQCSVETMTNFSRDIIYNRTHIIQKLDGPGWSVIAVAYNISPGSNEPRKLTIDVLIEDEILALEFKLIAPWQDN